MPPPEAATRHYLEQKALTAGIVRRARGIWSELDPANLDESWRSGRLGERLFVTVSAGQALAAGRADDYLDQVLLEQGIDPDRTATVASRSFAGIASDGRSLESLIFEPIIATKLAIGRHVGVSEAIRSGEASLVRIVGSQVQDANRAAVAAGMAARPAVTSYVRVLVPPSCGRCAVLAGRVYRWSDGFRRHNLCDCIHQPTTGDIAHHFTTDPQEYFHSLPAADQERYFGKSDAAAIREGADMGRVVNTHRRTGLAVAGRTNGASRRTVDDLVASHGSKAEVTAALREHGYLI